MLNYKLKTNNIITVDQKKRNEHFHERMIKKVLNSRDFNITKKIEIELNIIPEHMMDEEMKSNIIEKVEQLYVHNKKKLRELIHDALVTLGEEYNCLIQFFP